VYPTELPLQHAPPLPPALTELLQELLDFAVHLALGLLIGLVLYRLLHSRGLRWSWSLPMLALVSLLRVLLAGSGASGSATVLLVALALLAHRGRRRHLRELAFGSDLARAAAARQGPLDALRHAIRLALAREPAWLEPLKPALVYAGRLVDGDVGERWLEGDRMVLGVDEHGRPVSIPMGGVHGGTHTLVVGASGSGKTVTQVWIAMRAIEHGMGVIAIDPKGDPGMRAALCNRARATGRRYIEWTPQGPAKYNPYACGGDTEIADKVLAGERFTEPHYLRQAQRYLGHAVRTLRGLGGVVSLAELVRYLDPDQLAQLARRLEPGPARSVEAYLDSLSVRQRGELAGVRDRLAIMAESDIADWLDGAHGAEASFDLLGAVRERAIVYFSLESDLRPLLAQMLGAAIVQDLQTTVAALQAAPLETLVVIDEFAAVSSEQVSRLFGRARAAGMSLILGTQELADLRLPGARQLLEQVLGNLTAVIAHRQVVPLSAQEISRLAGSEGVWSSSFGSDGRSRSTRTQEYRLHPEELVSLGRGEAAVMVAGEGGSARLAHIHTEVSRG
jgi:TraM recognition site of TraD and TraG